MRVVLRLFDPDLARRVQRAFGTHISRSPSALAAPAFAASADGRRVLASIPAGNTALIVAESRVEHGSRAREMTVGAVEEATGARVLLLVRHGAETWRPPPATELAFGDELVVVATRAGMEQVLAITEEVAVTLGDHRGEEAGRAATWVPQSSSGS